MKILDILNGQPYIAINFVLLKYICMNPCIILTCALSTCMVMTGTECAIHIVDNCVLVPGVPKQFQLKLNCEAVLVNEPEEKRRYATKISRKERYGKRYASPSKASLKKRNKKRK